MIIFEPHLQIAGAYCDVFTHVFSDHDIIDGIHMKASYPFDRITVIAQSYANLTPGRFFTVAEHMD